MIEIVNWGNLTKSEDLASEFVPLKNLGIIEVKKGRYIKDDVVQLLCNITSPKSN